MPLMRCASARPIPDAAPVITQVRPARKGFADTIESSED
jgi:hypothetical protein